MTRRAAICALALALATCRRPAADRFPQVPVVLISIDTLRADHLPLYGYRAGATPNLDALGRQGIVFERLYSHCPQTLPAHASMLTGLLPPAHGVRDNIGFTLKEGTSTLASRLHAAGWATGGAVSAYVLRRQTGIAQGFDFFDDALDIADTTESIALVQRDGAVAVSSLLQWIESQRDRPFFAFLHLYEPHSPYTPPERYRNLPLAYDGEIAYADELVGRFLDRLRERGLLDRAVVAVTSDHGEGLKDHGEEEHGIFLYDEAVHVPLVIRLPGAQRAGLRVAGPVAQADIAPTLLDLVGQPTTGTDGASFRPALLGQTLEARSVYSESLYPRYHFGWSELYAATEARYRYIRAPRPELYDLERDPREKQNLAAERSAATKGMDDWLARRTGSAAPAPEEVSPDVREKLQALGYIGAAAPPPAGSELPDPKDRIGAYEDLRAAIALRKAGREADAVAAFRKVLADNPRMVDAWEMLGTTLAGMGRDADAIAAFGKVLAIEPERAQTHLALAKLHALAGRTDLAVTHAQIASRKDPGLGFETLAELMMDKGRAREAAEFARRSLAADDQRVMSHFILGVLARRAGRCEEALASLRKAEEAKARRKLAVVRGLHFNLGDCLARLGRQADAEREFQAELAVIPRSVDARVGLAMLYRSQGRDAEARSALTPLVTADPQPSADAYWTVVRTLAVLGDVAAAREWAARARSAFPSDPRFRRAG
jgi:choline-sulfatase